MLGTKGSYINYTQSYWIKVKFLGKLKWLVNREQEEHKYYLSTIGRSKKQIWGNRLKNWAEPAIIG